MGEERGEKERQERAKKREIGWKKREKREKRWVKEGRGKTYFKRGKKDGKSEKTRENIRLKEG